MRRFALFAIVFLAFMAPLAKADAKDNLQQLFDGAWEQAGLKDPTQLINCFTEDQA